MAPSFDSAKQFIHTYIYIALPPKRRNPVPSIALKKTLENIVAHDLTLLLILLEFKSTDSIMRLDRLNVRTNRHFDHFLSKMAYFLYFAKSSTIDHS